MKKILSLTVIGIFIIISQNIHQSNASSFELTYDDGTSEINCSPWSNEPGSEIAVRFTPKVYPVKLQKIKFYVTSARQPSTLFEVRIYDDNNGIYPGSRLDHGYIQGAGTVGNEWIEIDV